MSVDSGGAGGSYKFRLITTGTNLNVNGAGGLSVSTTGLGLAINNRYHVVATISASGVNIWVNGTQVMTNAGSPNMSTINAAASGKLRVGGFGAASEGFAGEIDEAAFYNVALNGTKVADHYDKSHNVDFDTAVLGFKALTAYFRLGETSGTTADDRSAVNNDGTYTGTPTLGLTGAVADGNLAAAFGNNDYVAMAANAAYESLANGITVACFIKASTFTDYGMIASRWVNGGGATNCSWFLCVRSSGKLEFALMHSDGSVKEAQSVATFNDGSYHFAVATYDNSTIRLYKDAANTLSDNDFSGMRSAVGTPLKIGAETGAGGSGAAFFNTSADLTIDEMIIVNRMLKQIEIDKLYANRL